MGTTLEVLIYEKIRIEADWSNAVALSVFQTLCLLLFSFLFVSRSHRTTEETQPVYILNSRLGLAWITMTNIFVVGAFTKSLFQSWGYWQEILMFWGDLVQGALGSFMIGLFTGGLVLALLLSVAYIWPDVWVDKFFRGFMSASTALLVLSF